MSVLSRYVIRSVLGYTLLVLAVLSILSALYLFITQQDDIGVGAYMLVDAFVFVALNVPQYVFDVLPVGALIGALFALGTLARSGELIVMRAAGISTQRIAAWVAMAGVILMGLTWVLGEYVAPQLEQLAREQKTFKKNRQYSLLGDRSAWAKDGNTFIAVQGQASVKNKYGGVYVFQLDDEHRLVSVGRARSVRVVANDRWQLDNYAESRIEGDRVITSAQSTKDLATRVSPEFLGLAVVDPGALTAAALYSYGRYLEANQLDSRTYNQAFWSRIARIVSVAVIVILAVPFAFGPMRSTGTGARTVVGIMIGASFFLLTRTLESGGLVFGASPFVTAWVPVAILATGIGIAVARVR
jgi:lipopolysaccharide export system permease protein